MSWFFHRTETRTTKDPRGDDCYICETDRVTITRAEQVSG